MKGGNHRETPREIEQARLRFERWRRSRKKVTRIPDRLWAAAVKAACLHGVNPTSIALGLDYNHLKQRVRLSGSGATPSARLKSTSFMELIVPPDSGHSRECTIELENARGAKMKIQLQNVGIKDLAEWIRTFWDDPR
ncbi:MAG TPA: hypothetical protein VFR18_11485 [Terriglobia bacterium]|nr:hypothetical protein [Terriglobia bacterium]